MHGSMSQAKEFIETFKQPSQRFSDIDILILPTFVYLSFVQDALISTPIKLGAQDLYLGAQGALTGAVSGPMLADVGCQYVLIGHSERRTIFQENLEMVAAKFKAAIEAKLCPILCVGETKAQREYDQTEKVIHEQLESVIKLVGIHAFQQAVIAYEPVWAIGTGLTASPEQAQVVHRFIRELIAKNQVDIARTIRILYGGSMKAENAAALFKMPDIDGGLIGGASLDAVQFLKICEAGSLTTSHVE